TEAVQGATFSPDGRLVVSWTGNREMKIWEAATGTVRWELIESKGKGKEPTPPSIHFSPDGRFLALPKGISAPLKIVATADFQELKLFDADSRPISIAFSP